MTAFADPLNGKPWEVRQGDALSVLRALPDECVQTTVCSPPYFGLRRYIDDGDPLKPLEVGLEETPDAYIARLVEVFREVRRVLRDDGTLWLNIGSSFATKPYAPWGIKPKDDHLIPHRLAMALQMDGWICRSSITWCKQAPMPESVTDRPTTATEMVFLLTKSPTYFYDQDAVRVPIAREWGSNNGGSMAKIDHESAEAGRIHQGQNHRGAYPLPNPNGRNLWSYWLLPPEPSPMEHYASYPTRLVEPCILAGTSAKGCCAACGAPWRRVVERGESSWERRKVAGAPMRYGDGGGSHQQRIKQTDPTDRAASGLGTWASSVTLGWQPSCSCSADVVPCLVLDPFTGSGTTGEVALAMGRRFIGIELNESYCELSRRRIATLPSYTGAKRSVKATEGQLSLLEVA